MVPDISMAAVEISLSLFLSLSLPTCSKLRIRKCSPATFNVTCALSCLNQAHLQSINAMVVSAVALVAWTSFHSSDGVDGGRNPLGIAIFGNDNGRTTRASEKGHTHIELRGENTLASNAGKIWNASPALRLALTRGEAKAAARLLALSAPL
jgi:hypothetical protein